MDACAKIHCLGEFTGSSTGIRCPHSQWSRAADCRRRQKVNTWQVDVPRLLWQCSTFTVEAWPWCSFFVPSAGIAMHERRAYKTDPAIFQAQPEASRSPNGLSYSRSVGFKTLDKKAWGP